MNYAIILAGGIGSRFWPLSTHAMPKQFLSLCSDKPILTESIERASALVGRDNIYIATNKIYKKQLSRCVGKLRIPKENLLFEPESRNTFAPISVLAQKIFSKDKDAVITVLPSDQFIKNRGEFLGTLKIAIKEAKNGNILTLGIVPERPETGFGYIKIKSKVNPSTTLGVDGESFGVEAFIEKPPTSLAKKFIKDKRYYWNAGIFVFQASILLKEIKHLQPMAYGLIAKIKDFDKGLNKIWSEFTATSIDYAIMEKTKKIKLLPLGCGWSDVGSWQAVTEISKKDKDGNIFKCDYNHIDLGSKNTLVWPGRRPVATLGLKNIIVVDTKDGLLVCSAERAQDVKKAVQALKRKKICK